MSTFIQAQIAFYDQHCARDAGDEDKRQWFIRWIKASSASSSSSLSSTYTNDRSMVTFSDSPATIDYYDQRSTKEAADESKRRRFIRWIKSKLGVRSRSKSNVRSVIYSTTTRSSTMSADHYFLTMDRVPPVLIIGGGISGLCLAQGLKKAGIPFTVFERDPTPNYRTQGYRLRINRAGYDALKANLFPEDFEVFLRSAGQFLPGYKYLDAHTGAPASADSAAFRHKATDSVFSADRAMLRSLLLTGLNEHEIQYGHAFKRYDVLPSGRVEVTFDNGRIIEGSVLVGAEGTTSRVRRQYVPHAATLLDTDSGAIYGKTPVTPELAAHFTMENTTMVRSSRSPRLCLVMEPLCSTDVNKSEFAEVSSSLSGFPDLEHYICWVLFGRAELFRSRNDDDVGDGGHDESQDLFLMSPREVAEISCEMTRSWAPHVRAIFKHQAPEWCSFLRISTTSPEIKSWEPSVVTLLGDAVHTMVPAGIGCNTALRDAQTLVQCFKEHGAGLSAIAAYERQMRAYGRENIVASVEAGKKMFGLPAVEQMRRVVY